jgi:hypothetical protein
MAWNLENYEDVNARIKRFRAEFPSGRLECYIEDIDIKSGYILVKALAYRNYEDDKPAAIDYAYEVRDSSKINANWWVENCVTSAYGRVIGALTPSDARPTRQDMEKVQRIEDDHKGRQNAAHSLLTAYEVEQMNAKSATEAMRNPVPSMAEAIESLQATLGAEVVRQSPLCKHGHMIMKSGISDKTGKAYQGYTCPSKSRQDQCPPIWFKEVDGQWLSPADYQDYLQERAR